MCECKYFTNLADFIRSYILSVEPTVHINGKIVIINKKGLWMEWGLFCPFIRLHDLRMNKAVLQIHTSTGSSMERCYTYYTHFHLSFKCRTGTGSFSMILTASSITDSLSQQLRLGWVSLFWLSFIINWLILKFRFGKKHHAPCSMTDQRRQVWHFWQAVLQILRWKLHSWIGLGQ